MQEVQTKLGWRFWGNWVLATTIGWPIGVVGAFILAHIVYMVYPKETNLVLGLCLGAVAQVRHFSSVNGPGAPLRGG
jgi:hypothetical protein